MHKAKRATSLDHQPRVLTLARCSRRVVAKVLHTILKETVSSNLGRFRSEKPVRMAGSRVGDMHTHDQVHGGDPWTEQDRPRLRPPPRSAITALLSLLLLVNLAASLYQLPLNRVIERRLCQEYYAEHDPAVIQPDGSIREELCKIDFVQQGLGWIQGTMDTLWVVGGEHAVSLGPLQTYSPTNLAYLRTLS